VALAREKSFYGEGLLDEVFEESMAEELAL